LMAMKLQRLQMKACYTSSSSSMLNLPCNSDACSLTFCRSEQMPSKQEDRWNGPWAHELAPKDVAWFVPTTVHIVTMLNRSTGKAKTLEFLNFCDH
jgi:hypothetical protein